MNGYIARELLRLLPWAFWGVLAAVGLGICASAASAQRTVLAPREGLEIFAPTDTEAHIIKRNVVSSPGAITLTGATSSLQEEELTVDVTPRDREVPVTLNEDRPEDFASGVFDARPNVHVEGAILDYSLTTWDVLGMAQFCHPPLYFEDTELERCGYCWGRHQETASAARFLADVFLLPARMLQQHPTSYVTTPRPID